MRQETVVYLREDGKSTLFSEIDGILMPELSKGCGIEINGASFVVRSYGVVISDKIISAVIHVE